MTIVTLPDLPFAYDALAPIMSRETLEYHHDKHHAAYVTKTNELLPGSGLESKKSLESIVLNAWKEKKVPLFNNSAQVWNHTFFWNGMKPSGGGKKLPADLSKKIEKDLDGYDTFRAKFVEACVSQFGSGWGWLAMDNATGKLEIMKTFNAETPFIHGKTALLTCDVWEHAYYIDYRNMRQKFVEAFVDSVINWEVVSERLTAGPLKIAA